mgnify:CR=1 FL=1
MTTAEASGATSGDCGQSAVATASVPQGPPAAPRAGAVGGCGQEPTAACGQQAAAAEPAGSTGLTRPLDAVEMRAWRAFLAASTSVSASLNHELEVGAGVSMHEYEILVRLSEAPDRQLRMSTLAGHVSHSRSRLTHTVGRLEKAGYVERASCAVDKRGVNCRLTEEGLSFLRTAAPIHLDGVRRHVVDRFTHEQLIALTGLLTVLVGGGTD